MIISEMQEYSFATSWILYVAYEAVHERMRASFLCLISVCDEIFAQ